jgi:hypothetical protein
LIPLLLAVFACTYLVNSREILEYNLTYPYTVMESSLTGTYNFNLSLKTSDEIEEIKASLIASSTSSLFETHVYLEHGEALRETSVYLMPELSRENLAKTHFNAYGLEMSTVDQNSVVLDRSTATSLGVREGDEVDVIHRDTGQTIPVTVSNIVPSYANTQGLLLDLAKAPHLVPDSVYVFLNEPSPPSFLEELFDGTGVELSQKEAMVEKERVRAEELLPDIKDNAQKWGSLLVSTVISLFFCGIRFRQDRRNLFLPLESLGFSSMSAKIVFSVSQTAVLLAIALTGLLLGTLFIWEQHHMLLSLMELLGTTMLVFGGFLAGLLLLLAGLVLVKLLNSLNSQRGKT